MDNLNEDDLEVLLGTPLEKRVDLLREGIQQTHARLAAIVAILVRAELTDIESFNRITSQLMAKTDQLLAERKEYLTKEAQAEFERRHPGELEKMKSVESLLSRLLGD